MLWNKRWNPMSEKFNQQIIPLNNNFIIAFEEIVIFKFYYQDDDQKKGTSTGRNEGTNVSASTIQLSKDKNLTRVSRSTTTIPNEAFFEKKSTATGTVKKSRRGHKWRTTKRYEKIQKGFKWRVYRILPLCIFFGVLFSEKCNNSLRNWHYW